MALTRVAVLLQSELAPFELGVIHEVFGVDRTDDGVPAMDFLPCAEQPRTAIPMSSGMTLVAPYAFTDAVDCDLVAVPAFTTSRTPSPAMVETLRAAHDRGAAILSVCSGAFALGAAGLLDGRRCTTHWLHTAELAALHPRASVDPDVLYVQDDRVITSAGTAAGIDACLHLVRSELGAEAATRIARRMVVPPHRQGGQRQFIDRPVPSTDAESLGPVLTYVLDNLHEQHPVAELARRAHLSERTFARRFVAETGVTPHQWVTEQRVHRARELLESSTLAVEAIARESGFGSAALLRHHFTQATGVAPTAYRETHAGQRG